MPVTKVNSNPLIAQLDSPTTARSKPVKGKSLIRHLSLRGRALANFEPSNCVHNTETSSSSGEERMQKSSHSQPRKKKRRAISFHRTSSLVSKSLNAETPEQGASKDGSTTGVKHHFLRRTRSSLNDIVKRNYQPEPKRKSSQPLPLPKSSQPMPVPKSSQTKTAEENSQTETVKENSQTETTEKNSQTDTLGEHSQPKTVGESSQAETDRVSRPGSREQSERTGRLSADRLDDYRFTYVVYLTKTDVDQIDFNINLTRAEQHLVTVAKFHDSASAIASKLRVGDMVISINGASIARQNITCEQDLKNCLMRSTERGEVSMTVERQERQPIRQASPSNNIPPAKPMRRMKSLPVPEIAPASTLNAEEGSNTIDVAESAQKANEEADNKQKMLDEPASWRNTPLTINLNALGQESPSVSQDALSGDTAKSPVCIRSIPGQPKALSHSPLLLSPKESAQSISVVPDVSAGDIALDGAAEVTTPLCSPCLSPRLSPGMSPASKSPRSGSSCGVKRVHTPKTAAKKLVETKRKGNAWLRALEIHQQRAASAEPETAGPRMSQLANVFVNGADKFSSSAERRELLAECLADKFDLPFLR